MSIDKDGLASLLERVREAKRPDRELDFRIHIATVDDAVWPVRDRLGRITNPNYRMSDYLRDYTGVINSDDQDFDFPRYTTSIDASLALVERLLPGEGIVLETHGKNVAGIGQSGKFPSAGATPALAILVALLSALKEVRQMEKLTKAQMRFLADCREFELGPTPRGLPAGCADMRSHEALLHRGLIAYNGWSGEYVLTPTGRLALEASNE